MFLSPWFAVAGLLAAAGPVVIHLLNRRRYKTVHWAAMDFLREAVRRSRRILQFRDLLLLAIRAAVLVLLGVALARPFLSGTMLADPNQPVHAVILLDNGMSMGYELVDETLLDRAKAEARRHIERLPRGSRVSVLPTCGAPAGFSYDAYYTKADALEALSVIRAVDRATLPHETIDLALDACRRIAAPTAKEVVLFSDRPAAVWGAGSLVEHAAQLSGGLRVVEVRPETDVENAWIADFYLRDGVADMQSPATFVAQVKYEGAGPRPRTPVTLTVEGEVIQTAIVDLQPGQTAEVQFEAHQFDVPAEPGRPYFATAEVSLPADRLPADDRRLLVVPVMATLPVVFVDQFGKEESAARGRLGETQPLRTLLAPVTQQTAGQKSLVQIDHRTIDELQPAVLEDARVVVVAGVASPGSAAPLLRQYVEQGGNLLIAAGGSFEPALWTSDAWLEGLGVLPLPLDDLPVGQLPDEAGRQLAAFHLDFESLKDQPYFAIEGETPEYLRDLYAKPFFFKAVAAKFDDEARQAFHDRLTRQLAERQSQLEELDAKIAPLRRQEAEGKLSAAERQQLSDFDQQRGRIEPNWLRWNPPADRSPDTRPAAEQAEASLPVVVARYSNGLPFLAERRIGRGRVLLVTTGLRPHWNTLAPTYASVIYDRIFRQLLAETLPRRVFSTQRPVLLPIAADDRRARFSLTAPDGAEQPISVEAVGADRFAVALRDCFNRGIYRVTASRAQDTGGDTRAKPLWVAPLAINGPADEAQPLSSAERERLARASANSAATGDTVLAGAVSGGPPAAELWRWCILAVFVGLLCETMLLAWTTPRGEPAR